MPVQLAHRASSDLVELMRLERQAFAAKLRMTRALIGWSQSDLALRVGLTQRSVHKLEQGDTEPRRATVYAIEQLWAEQGIEFEERADGGFRVSAHPALFDNCVPGTLRRQSAPAQRRGSSNDH